MYCLAAKEGCSSSFTSSDHMSGSTLMESTCQSVHMLHEQGFYGLVYNHMLMKQNGEFFVRSIVGNYSAHCPVISSSNF